MGTKMRVSLFHKVFVFYFGLRVSLLVAFLISPSLQRTQNNAFNPGHADLLVRFGRFHNCRVEESANCSTSLLWIDCLMVQSILESKLNECAELSVTYQKIQYCIVLILPIKWYLKVTNWCLLLNFSQADVYFTKKRRVNINFYFK